MMRPKEPKYSTRPRQLWRRAARVLIVVTFCAEAWVLFTPTSGIRGAGRRLYLIDAVPQRTRIGQTFRILHDGLDSVSVQLSVDRLASIDIRWRLLGTGTLPGDAPWVSVVESTENLRLARGRSEHRFRFTPIFPSENQVYQFEIQPLGARALDSEQPVVPRLQVVASRDDALIEGNAIIGDTQVIDRDLFFEAATASLFTTFWERASRSLPRWLKNEVVQVGLLVIYNWALAAFVFHLLARWPDADEPDRRARAAS